MRVWGAAPELFVIAEKYGHLVAIMWLKLAAMFTTHDSWEW
jgi:hypothetical protein